MSRALLLSASLVALLQLQLLSTSAHASSTDEAQTTYDIFRWLPRVPIGEGDVLADTRRRVCAYEPPFDVQSSHGECEWNVYAQTLATLGMPGVAFGLFVVLLFATVACARACCNCCGGERPSDGCCCPSSSSSHGFRGYTGGRIACVKVTLIVLALLSMAGAGVAFWGSWSVHDAVPAALDEVRATSAAVGDAVAAINVLRTVPAFNQSSFVRQLERLESYAVDVDNATQRLEGPADTLETVRFALTAAVCAWACLIGLALFVVVLAESSSSSTCARVLAVLTVLAVVVALVAYVLAGVVVADTCYESVITSSRVVSFDHSAFSTLIPYCGANNDGSDDDPFNAIARDLDDLARQTYTSACDAYLELCGAAENATATPCAWPTSAACVDAMTANTTDTAARLVNGTDVFDRVPCGSAQCTNVPPCTGQQQVCKTREMTVYECATTCADSGVRDRSESLVLHTDGITLFADVRREAIEPFLDCEFVLASIAAVTAPLCTDGMSGVGWLCLGLIVVCAAMTLAGLVLFSADKVLVVKNMRTRDGYARIDDDEHAHHHHHFAGDDAHLDPFARNVFVAPADDYYSANTTAAPMSHKPVTSVYYVT